MKNLFEYRNLKNIILMGSLAFAASSCDKTPEIETLSAISATKDDLARGGTWRTYVLTNISQEIPLAAPTASSSDSFKTELATALRVFANLSSEQKTAIQYWGAGSVYRWQELTREVAANYNVPPKFDAATGKYLVPDPNNPSAFPKFPFANPPYTSRALALLSVAQYDALVACWHYKKLHNRLSPSTYDPKIVKSLPQNVNIPSFPSEDAVVAAASREILSVLFPNEKAIWAAKAEENKNIRLWAGTNVESDIAAGEIIGKAVAAKILAYSRTDGMGGANAQANVPAQRDSARARGFTNQWQSLEIPARPPMLPFFGNVKTWNMTRAEMILAARPAAPPSVGSAEFTKALDELKAIAKNRSAEQTRIANYWSDGLGSYTPPGHWNRLAADAARGENQNELRTARTMALVSTAVQDAGVSCWDTKYYYYLPRPFQADAAVTTSLGIPNFPAYTSGHSTFSAAAATVLGHLFPTQKEDFDKKAKEASESRIYGCIHYRFDCEVGLTSGKAIGNFAIARARTDGAD